MRNLEHGTDLIVFSSNSFDSTEYRTSELMARFAKRWRVYFFEAPIIGVTKEPTYFLRKNEHQVTIVQPYLPAETSVFEQKEALLSLLKELIFDEDINIYTIWTDTPKSMPFIRNLNSEFVVYDCVKNYSALYPELEEELFQYADVVLNKEAIDHRHPAINPPRSLSRSFSSIAGKAYHRYSVSA